MTLDFGITRDDNGVPQVICRRNDHEVFWVRDTIITPLAKAGVRWRDPKVLNTGSWGIAALEISHGDTLFVAQRDQGMWTIDGQSADGAAIQKLLKAAEEG